MIVQVQLLCRLLLCLAGVVECGRTKYAALPPAERLAIMVALNEVNGAITGEYQVFSDSACVLTVEEQKVAQLLGDARNLYLGLPVEHPMGRDEFCRAIPRLKIVFFIVID